MKIAVAFLRALFVAGLVYGVSFGMGLPSRWPGTLLAFGFCFGNTLQMLVAFDLLRRYR